MSLSVWQLADPSVVESLREDFNTVHTEVDRLRSQLILTEEEMQKQKAKFSTSQTNLSTLTNEREALEEANTRLKDRITRLEVSGLMGRIRELLFDGYCAPSSGLCRYSLRSF